MAARPAKSASSTAKRRTRRTAAPLTWDIAMPLATHPLIVRQYVMASLIVGFIMFALLGFIFAVEGEWEMVGEMVVVGLVSAAIIFVFSMVVSVVILGNRLKVRYTLDDGGVALDVIDRVARAAHRMAAVAGAARGSAAAAGAGLTAMAGEHRSAAWRGVREAIYRPRTQIIELRNRWRTYLFIYCPAERFDEVAAFVRDQVAAHAGDRRPDTGANPVFPALGWTVAVMIASVPFFILPWPFELHLFPNIALVTFAVATVWLIPMLAVGVLTALAGIAAQVVYLGLEMHKSVLGGSPFSGFDSISSDEWPPLLITAACFAFLAWFAIRNLRGRSVSMLAQDEDEMDEEPDEGQGHPSA